MIAFTLLLLLLFSLLSTAHSLTSEFVYILDVGYPIGRKLFGNIAGIDVDNKSNVIIFHRGSHKWDASTFDVEDIYQPSKDSPIPEATVVLIDPVEKEIIRAWGRNRFFMPHGLSLDSTGEHVWLTDVALHQVFKYKVDGSQEVIALGTPFIPGSDESHFCKPTSVADTGEFIFVADGYCNSRVIMFSPIGKYISEFGQSPEAAFLSKAAINQPIFNIPHKVTYAKEAKMLCIADREHGRIQCFTFDPKRTGGSILDGQGESAFTIADPLFNGRLFSIDYSPIRGGIIAAVSGESQSGIPAMGFVYNVTTGQLISRFAPPKGRQFGMAHDLAITGDQAESLYVVDISPVNLWKFSRAIPKPKNSRAVELTHLAGEGLSRAISIVRENEHNVGFIWYIIIMSFIVIIIVLAKARKLHRATNPFASLHSSSYPINSLFGGRFPRRAGSLNSTLFSRQAFFNLFQRKRQQSDFSRIPLEDSDNTEDDKSDSDVEEFNINKASHTKITV